MMKQITLSSLFFLIALAGCGKSDSDLKASAQEAGPNLTGKIDIFPEAPAIKLPEGISILVTTPAGSGRRVNEARMVPEKTVSLTDFKRTLESTYLKLSIQISNTFLLAGDVSISLMNGGSVVQSTHLNSDARSPIKLELGEFITPMLSQDQRAAGFANVSYELIIKSGTKQTRVPFQITIFDEFQPTYVVPRSGECLIYAQPERASGCYQNRTRTTQDVSFNDSVTKTHEIDVQFSGALSIPISIVSLSFGAQRTTLNGIQVSQGSDIHFTNCILCSSVIYRQEVKSIRKGDVFQVMADGSLVMAGSTTVTSTSVAYEYTSTGSESQDYSCEIPSQLPVGYGPGCSQ